MQKYKAELRDMYESDAELDAQTLTMTKRVVGMVEEGDGARNEPCSDTVLVSEEYFRLACVSIHQNLGFHGRQIGTEMVSSRQVVQTRSSSSTLSHFEYDCLAVSFHGV